MKDLILIRDGEEITSAREEAGWVSAEVFYFRTCEDPDVGDRAIAHIDVGMTFLCEEVEEFR